MGFIKKLLKTVFKGNKSADALHDHNSSFAADSVLSQDHNVNRGSVKVSNSTWSWFRKVSIIGSTKQSTFSLNSTKHGPDVNSTSKTQKPKSKTSIIGTRKSNHSLGQNKSKAELAATRSKVREQRSKLALQNKSAVVRSECSKLQSSTSQQRTAFLNEHGFTLERDIGSGAFANVYLAKNNDATVAIKRVNLAAKQNAKFVFKFLCRELTCHAQLRHPCIIQYYASSQHYLAEVTSTWSWSGHHEATF